MASEMFRVPALHVEANPLIDHHSGVNNAYPIAPRNSPTSKNQSTDYTESSHSNNAPEESSISQTQYEHSSNSHSTRTREYSVSRDTNQSTLNRISTSQDVEGIESMDDGPLPAGCDPMPHEVDKLWAHMEFSSSSKPIAHYHGISSTMQAQNQQARTTMLIDSDHKEEGIRQSVPSVQVHQNSAYRLVRPSDRKISPVSASTHANSGGRGSSLPRTRQQERYPQSSSLTPKAGRSFHFDAHPETIQPSREEISSMRYHHSGQHQFNSDPINTVYRPVISGTLMSRPNVTRQTFAKTNRTNPNSSYYNSRIRSSQRNGAIQRPSSTIIRQRGDRGRHRKVTSFDTTFASEGRQHRRSDAVDIDDHIIGSNSSNGINSILMAAKHVFPTLIVNSSHESKRFGQPNGFMQFPSQPTGKRKRLKHGKACEACRLRKVRCSGGRPCNQCQLRQECCRDYCKTPRKNSRLFKRHESQSPQAPRTSEKVTDLHA